MGTISTVDKMTYYKVPEGAKYLVIEEHVEWEDLPECLQMSFISEQVFMDFDDDEVKEPTHNYDDTAKMFFSKENKLNEDYERLCKKIHEKIDGLPDSFVEYIWEEIERYEP